ncbi:hypothetical protein RFI_20677, partial [Reticulomyxa filosa]
MFDPYTYGKPLFYYCVQQLAIKDRECVWDYLIFLMSALPSGVAVRLLQENKEQLSKLRMESLETLCEAMIEASEFPAAMSLYLAAFMKERAQNDLSREEQLMAISDRYIKIARGLLEKIESDHLLAIMFEIPSSIHDMSLFDIALRFELYSFLDFHRLPPLMLQMWYKYEYLDPKENFIQVEKSNFKLLRTLFYTPNRFYFTPVGQYITKAWLYLLYVLYVSWITYQQIYPYQGIRTQEYVLWILNLGFVSFELVELIFDGRDYFSELVNCWDSLICLIWVVLALMRFSISALSFSRTKHSESGSEYSLQQRNTSRTSIFMLLWGAQCVLLWTRLASFLQRNPSTGSLLTMIVKMASDIL